MENARILKRKNYADYNYHVKIEKEEDSRIDCTIFKMDEPILYGRLIRENNRGWTIVNYSVTGQSLELFFSRGLWEEFIF